jgi:DNA mismatch repair protein MutS
MQERQRTGISSLKVGYNTIFGYYIEVTKPNLHLVPQNYIRKQTLSNAERFYTQELKNKELEVLESESKIEELQRTIFNKICKEIDNYRTQIQHLSSTLAELDIYTALATLARENDYCKPTVNNDFIIDIRDGRHPVVEKTVPIRFVPNDTYLDGKDTQIIILTGPNMAGKSTYIRQVALIVILAQIGSFVPAKSATIGVVDRIFTRIGAGENLYTGKSTFMVEMTETAYILNNVTERSLVILDEIGRGTSTFDGISIAWACIEYLNKQRTISNYGPKVLCATHYFELTYLSNILEGVKNYNISVKEWGEQVVFLHKIVAGPADKSYGIYVAKLAGLPHEVVMRAKEVIKLLESSTTRYNLVDRNKYEKQPALLNAESNDIINKVINEIKEADLNNLTPLEIFTKVAMWKKMLTKEKL